MLKEACVGSYKEGIAAWKQGADRLELCENLAEGGTTPSYGTVKKLVGSIDIPVVVMIRPRGGNFVYLEEEIEIMIEDIKLLKNLNVDGFVLGVLDTNNKIDYPLLTKLLKECRGHKVTFHKAIDDVDDPAAEVKKLADLGIDRILTSGKEVTALEGQCTLNKMIKSAENSIEIVVAGRVTNENIEEISSIIKAKEFHGKLIVGKL